MIGLRKKRLGISAPLDSFYAIYWERPLSMEKSTSAIYGKNLITFFLRVLTAFIAGCASNYTPPPTPDHGQISVFFVAIREGDVATMTRSLDEFPKLIDMRDQSFNLPLQLSAKYDQLGAAQLLLDRLSIQNRNIQAAINEKNSWLNGTTPLNGAASKGSADMVRWLLAHNADIRVQDNDGNTALHDAAALGHKDVAIELVNSKAPIDAVDNNGNTPLIDAAGNGRADVTMLLLANGANINAKNKNGATALHGAAEQGHADVVKILLAHGASSEMEDNNGWTALAFASNAVVADLLLAHTPDVDTRGASVALHRVAYWGRVDVARVLIAHGADANGRDNNGDTPLHMAALAGQKELVQLLLNDKADPDIKDKHGNTPLYWAVQGGHRDVVELLVAGTAERVRNSNQQVRKAAIADLAKSGVVVVNAQALNFLDSLGTDLIYFTRRDDPIQSFMDITDPTTQFAVQEFSPRMMSLRRFVATKSPPLPSEQMQAAPSNVQPIGQTYMSSGSTELMGIGPDEYGQLFEKNPQLKLFCALRGDAGANPIQTTGGGMRICFIELK